RRAGRDADCRRFRRLRRSAGAVQGGARPLARRVRRQPARRPCRDACSARPRARTLLSRRRLAARLRHIGGGAPIGVTGLVIRGQTPYITAQRSWAVRQDNIPRGRTIPMGAVPALARGLWHTAPTYLRRRPGSPSNGRLGSAPGFITDWRNALSSTDAGPKALLRRQALARRKEVAPDARTRLAE